MNEIVDDKHNNITYPCVGKYTNGMIVVFENKTTGMVFKDPTGLYSAGYRSEFWSKSWNPAVEHIPPRTEDPTQVFEDKETTQVFEDGGLQLFKPASYVVVKANESIYNRLTKKYNLPNITHRIALAIDKTAEQGDRVIRVVFWECTYIDAKPDDVFFMDIKLYDHDTIYDIIKRELEAVGGYYISALQIDTQRATSYFTLEW